MERQTFNQVVKHFVEKPIGPGYIPVGQEMLKTKLRGVPPISSSTLNRIVKGEREPSAGERKLILMALESLKAPLDDSLKRAILHAPYVSSPTRVEAIHHQEVLLDFVKEVEDGSKVSALYGAKGPRARTDPESMVLLYLLIVHGECSFRAYFRPLSESEWGVNDEPPWVSVIEMMLAMALLAHDQKKNKTLAELSKSVDHKDPEVGEKLVELQQRAEQLDARRLDEVTIDEDIINLLLRKVTVYCRPSRIADRGYPDIDTLFLAEPPATARGKSPMAISVDDDGVPTRRKSYSRIRDFFDELKNDPESLQSIVQDDLVQRAKKMKINLTIGRKPDREKE